jgi:hypothetical protein
MRISSKDLERKSLLKRAFVPEAPAFLSPVFIASEYVNSSPYHFISAHKSPPRPPFLPFTGGHLLGILPTSALTTPRPSMGTQETELPCLDPGTASDVEVMMKGGVSTSGTLPPMGAHKRLAQQKTLQIFTRPNSVVVCKNALIITQQIDLLVGVNEHDVDDLFFSCLTLCLAQRMALQGYEDDRRTREIGPQGVRLEIVVNPPSIQAFCRSQTLFTSDQQRSQRLQRKAITGNPRICNK